MSHRRIAPPDDPARALMKNVALDIGKEVVAYIEWMYPQAVSATSSTFGLSVRNSIANEIVAATDFMVARGGDEAAILAWLADRKHHRREMKRRVAHIRDTDYEDVRAKIAASPDPDKAFWDEFEKFENGSTFDSAED